MRKTWLLLIIPALFLLPGKEFVFSQEAKKTEISSSEETLYKGEIKSISVNTPTRVVIGKPEIADVLSVSTKEIIIVGNGPGSTNLIWWDGKGEHHVSLKVLAEAMGYSNTRIKSLIKELNLPNVSTQPSDSEGKVLLLGSVKTAEDLERIKTALGVLFPKTTNLIQVEEEKAIIQLDVEIIEVDKGSIKDLGMDWFGSGGQLPLTEAPRFAAIGRLADVPHSMSRVTEWTHLAPLEASLNLMVKEGKARILSRPRLACQSGKEAELLVGGEKPNMTTQTSGTGGSSNTVEYKEYGIKLKMAPALNSDGKIKLGLNVEVSDVEVAEVLGDKDSPTARAYPLIKRSTSTQLYLNNGQTLAISGLIKQKTEEELRKFPWLGDVPILGLFFRSRTTTRGGGNETRADTELVILITPSLVEEKGAKKENSPADKKDQSKAQAADPSQPGKNISGSTEQQDAQEAAVDTYSQDVAAFLKNNILYPWSAKQAGLEGTVVLNLHLANSGDLMESNISASSGLSVLDENALRLARQITPYPVFPRSLSEQDLWVQIPVVYNLKETR
jgi:pilus assembly protein CpaC